MSTNDAPNIAVIGSINIDFVIRTETLPTAGETLGGGEFETFAGGKGANQALAAQRLGGDVSMYGCVGNDNFSEIALGNLAQAGVNLNGVSRIDEAMTGAAFINVSHDGENQIAVASGANALLKADAIDLSNAKAVISQLETPQQTTLESVANSDNFFCLNAAPAIELDPALLERTDLLVVNDTEAAYYQAQLKSFRGLIAKTYGADGAALFRGNEELAAAKPPKVDVVDTTGAGDTFVGALVVALMKDLDHQQALQFACAAGAKSTTKLGAQNAIPTYQEIQAS